VSQILGKDEDPPRFKCDSVTRLASHTTLTIKVAVSFINPINDNVPKTTAALVNALSLPPVF